eukprot:Gb_29377 [translate_table: standard]
MKLHKFFWKKELYLQTGVEGHTSDRTVCKWRPYIWPYKFWKRILLHSFGQFLSRLYRCARKSRQISEAAFIAAEPYSEQYCTGCTEFKNNSRLSGFLDSRSYRPVEFSASDWHEKRGAGSGSTAK